MLINDHKLEAVLAGSLLWIDLVCLLCLLCKQYTSLYIFIALVTISKTDKQYCIANKESDSKTDLGNNTLLTSTSNRRS
jgi:hypothetical protein